MSLARVRALVVIGVLTFIAMSTVIWAIVKDDQTRPQAQACTQKVKASTAIPPAKAVKLRVLNATDHSGLASTAKTQLQAAGFANVTTGNEGEAVEATAEVRFGPAGVGAAYLVMAHVKHAKAVPDDRKDPSVDLILGDDYTTVGITPVANVKAELDRLGKPQYEAAEC